MLQQFSVFPDGEARPFSLEQFGISSTDTDQMKMLITEKMFPVWVADERFVYDTLEQWAANDSLLAGKLDLARIGSFGHSFGGATALEVCRVELLYRAAANMDWRIIRGGNHSTHSAPVTAAHLCR